MNKQLLAILMVFTLVLGNFAYAQGGKKGMGRMGDSVSPGMGQERGMGMGPDQGMKGQADPLSRINKFLTNPNISNETKEVIINEFKKFSEETFQLRLKHEEALYKWRKERMEKQHMARLEKLKEQNALKNSLNYSSPESLKEFSEKMKSYRQNHREMMMEGKEEQREEMSKMRDEFKAQLKGKADDFKKKIKEIVKNARVKK